MTAERLGDSRAKLSAVIADDRFVGEIDAETVQHLGDVERVGIGTGRCQHLASDRQHHRLQGLAHASIHAGNAHSAEAQCQVPVNAGHCIVEHDAPAAVARARGGRLETASRRRRSGTGRSRRRRRSATAAATRALSACRAPRRSPPAPDPRRRALPQRALPPRRPRQTMSRSHRPRMPGGLPSARPHTAPAPRANQPCRARPGRIRRSRKWR